MADWTVVGTDDNKPYSMQYDVSRFAKGTSLDLRAIVKTRSGDLNADMITVTAGEIIAPPPATGSGAEYLVVHYNRPGGDYDGWGLHAFGDIEGTVDWATPIPFTGEDAYGRFAWVKVKPGASSVGFIVHNGDAKDPDGDRFANPQLTPEVWLTSGDSTVDPSLAAARGFARIHYNRPAEDYAGWGLHLWGDAIDATVVTSWTSPRPFDGIDDFGAYWDVPLKNPEAAVNFIIHNGDEKDVGTDEIFIPSVIGELWRNQGVATIHRTLAAAEGYAEIHYHRTDGNYGDYTTANDFWGLHVWTGAQTETQWAAPLKPVRVDSFGPVFQVPLAPDATRLNFIIHRGDAKDPNGDQALDLAVYGNQTWFVSGQEKDNLVQWLLPIVARGVDADLTQAQAQWVARDTVLWKAESPDPLAYSLRWSTDGGITAGPSGVVGGRTIRLAHDPDGMTPELAAKWPHLAGYQVFKVRSTDLAMVPQALRGQVVAVEKAADGSLRRATSVQIPGVLDDLYAAQAADVDLGPTMSGRTTTLRLWAPTAQSARALVFDSATATSPSATLDMTRDDATGVWSVAGKAWQGRYYLYEVDGLGAQHPGGRHQPGDRPVLAVPVDQQRAQPDRRPRLQGPPTPRVGRHQEANAEEAGGHLALRAACARLLGQRHVRAGRQARHVRGVRPRGHERHQPPRGARRCRTDPCAPAPSVRLRDRQRGPEHLGDTRPRHAGRAAAGLRGPTGCRDCHRGQGRVQLGLRPAALHGARGQLQHDPRWPARIVEFREMVQALNATGLRVVMDVVYNHTNASGQDPKSVLDRIVPGYYHRLNDKGASRPPPAARIRRPSTR